MHNTSSMPARQNKIILTGFRATGKTTVGRLLAAELGLSFVDMDQELIRRHGPIRELVASKGWPFFRQKEKELLTELVAATDVVIATGGGAIMHTDTWAILKGSGLVVWLSVPVAEIRKRMSSDAVSSSQRPALTDSDALQEVEKLLKEREPLYRAGSHLELNAAHTPPLQLVEQIRNYLKFKE